MLELLDLELSNATGMHVKKCISISLPFSCLCFVDVVLVEEGLSILSKKTSSGRSTTTEKLN